MPSQLPTGTSPDLDTKNPEPSTTLTLPEGGLRGWLCVAGLFLFNCATWASNSAYAVYLAHYLQYDTFPNASKLDYAAIGGLAFGGGLLFAPLIRNLQRVLGWRITIVVGAACQLLGILLAAYSTQLWEIYMTQGVLMGFSLALITIPSMTILPQWFRNKRSLAMAIAASGSGCGGLVFNLALQEVVNRYGLRWAFIVQAICCSACAVGGLLLSRSRDKELNALMDIWDWKMLGYMSFWLMTGFVCMTLLGYVVLMYNLADFTISLGYTAHQGSIVSGMISVGIIFGRPLMGRLADMFGPITTCLCAHVFVAILCLAMWIPCRNFATAIAFALLVGATMGTLWVVLAPIGVRLVGLRNLSVAIGMMWVAIGVFGIVSPIIGIKLRGSPPDTGDSDPTQYRDPAIWCGVVYLVSAVMLWFIRAYLITRDKEAVRLNSEEDADELHISVHWRNWFGELFSTSKTRKV